MLGMSRAAFYVHVKQGHFLAPIYSTGTRRPVYTEEMQRQNLEVKATQVAVDGSYVIFNERQPREPSRNQSNGRRRSPSSAIHDDLRRGLEGLGLRGMTDEQIEQATATCFPEGTTGVAQNDLLRVVFRQLRRQ